MNKLSYRYTISDIEYKGSESVAHLPTVRSRVIDGKEVLTITGYYDPESPFLSWLEKPDGSFASTIGYARWGIVGFLSLIILGRILEKKA